jgi:hypothetical protein
MYFDGNYRKIFFVRKNIFRRDFDGPKQKKVKKERGISKWEKKKYVNI